MSGPDTYPRDMIELLTEVAERGGSDLHIAVGRPPTMRHHGHLVELDAPVLKPSDSRNLVLSIMNEAQRDELDRTWEADFAYSITHVARLRINAYFQRGSVGAAARILPPTIGSFADLGLPPV
ncbi:MAG TPA: type IV pili twitching motility protein PilT, partial [Coriobacteriia bacterium]